MIDEVVKVVREAPQAEMPSRHFLLEGMYLRQVLIREGILFIGREHKKPHYFMVLKGSCGIHTENGIKVLKAGMVLMSPPGTRRAGITYEDTIFVTVHRTEETDLERIESDLTEIDPNSRYGVGNVIQPLLEKAS